MGLWAGSVCVPAAITEIATREGYGGVHYTVWNFYATMLLAAATILGCSILPYVAQRLGRTCTLALLSACTAAAMYTLWLPHKYPTQC